MTSGIKTKVFGSDGYSLDLYLSDEELLGFRQLVRSQWLEVILKNSPDALPAFKNLAMEQYHTQAHLLDHESVWPKANRILPLESLQPLRQMAFMQRLAEVFGPFDISDEDDVGREEIYWRIVRPNAPADVGPLHADAWFWELGPPGKLPAGKIRVKIWIALVCEPGLNGLRLAPGSHLKDWRYHGEKRHGIMKPVFDEKEETIGAELIPTAAGQAIVFNDRLLHGGALNRGNKTRVSAEFTLLVDESNLR
jgi:hypothetical protein